MKTPPFWKLFPAVLLISMIGLVATDVYLPSLPGIQKAFETTPSLVKLTLTAFLITFSLSQLFYGPISDRFGRRPVIYIGLGVSLIGSGICLFAPSIHILLLGRALQGVALGAPGAIWRAILRDLYKGEKLAYYGSFFAAGAAAFMTAAPILGGYIESYLGWRMNFLFLILLALLTCLLMWCLLPETNPNRAHGILHPTRFFKVYWRLVRSPVFMGYLGCTGVAFAGLYAYLGVSPFLFQKNLGLSPVQFGWLALVIGAGIGSGGWLNSRIVCHLGRHKTLELGLIVLLLASVAFCIPAVFGKMSVLLLIVPFYFYAVGCGVTFPTSFASAFHGFGDIAGFAGAFYGAGQILGGAAGTLFASFVKEKTQLPIGLFLLACGIAGYLLQLFAFRKASQERP